VPRNRLKLFEQEIPWSAEAKYLGIHLKTSFTWKAHISILEQYSFLYLSASSLIRPIPLYGALAWGYAARSTVKKLQVIQNTILLCICDRRRCAKLRHRIRQYDKSITVALGITISTCTAPTRDQSRSYIKRSEMQPTYEWSYIVAVAHHTRATPECRHHIWETRIPRVSGASVHSASRSRGSLFYPEFGVSIFSQKDGKYLGGSMESQYMR
jgi:hypothetical protein